MTRSASSRTACSTSASLYLLPERDWFAEEPSSGTPRDQARRAISSCSAPAFSSMSIVSPREERSRVSGVSREKNGWPILLRRHHRERQAVLVDHGVDDLALALPDLRESIEHVPVAEHAAGLVEVALLAGENARDRGFAVADDGVADIDGEDSHPALRNGVEQAGGIGLHIA